mmetsp:Transcript_99084/g.186173  ORF Transcript_99084/g.186173 Transcript_99084/m.186173 type:complete len:258 (+) Transcript_99084:3-776(+)
MFVDVEPVFMMRNWNSRARFRARQVLDAEKVLKWSDEVDMLEFFAHNLEINALRMPYSKDFSYIFNMGYQNYHQGEWGAAERILANTRTMLGFEDGPSGALLQFMKDPYDFVAPYWWRGVHNLDAEIGVPHHHAGPRESIHCSRPLKAETLRCSELMAVFPGLRGTAFSYTADPRSSCRSITPRDTPRSKESARAAEVAMMRGSRASALKARQRASSAARAPTSANPGAVVERSVSRAAGMSEVAAEEPALNKRMRP